MTNKIHIPIQMIEPDKLAKTCPPCNDDCCQGDTCPSRLQSTADYGDRELTHVLLALVFFWLLVSVGLFWAALQ